MKDSLPFRAAPLLPHRPALGDDIQPECGHSVTLLCDGCSSCASCEGCYCGEAENEPHALADID